MSDPKECSRCRKFVNEQGWALLGAAASIGIEKNRNTDEVIGEFLVIYHKSGHNVKALEKKAQRP